MSRRAEACPGCALFVTQRVSSSSAAALLVELGNSAMPGVKIVLLHPSETVRLCRAGGAFCCPGKMVPALP